nr:hypothetical protein CFP56_09111 [Quercus suber]
MPHSESGHATSYGGALDVSFSRIGNHDGESSSQAESRSSHSGHRSSGERDAPGRTTPTPPSDQHRPYVSPKHSLQAEEHSHGSKTGGFLLDSVLATGRHSRPSKRGKQKMQNGHIHVDKARASAAKVPADLSSGSSPLSREIPMDNSATDESAHQTPSRSMGMDPAQLVQMALNLSESRRRNVSGGLPVSLISPQGKRVSSGQASRNGAISASTNGDSLTADFADSSPSSNKSTLVPRISISGTVNPVPDNTPLHFSPATLARAEKARKYFELASEHRRLLEHLPPLRPDSSAPGNFTFSTTSAAGYASPTITRVASHANDKFDLGRQYNPIQALRNRRLRGRERRPLTAPPVVWQDVNGTRNWVDHVEAATADSGFRNATDRVQLPVFLGDDASRADTPDRTKGHRRTSTSGSVITRPENGWTVEPTELLADTYWTEKSDNKTLIEDRNGNKIFPNLGRLSLEPPRNGDDLSTVVEPQAKSESDREDSHSDRRTRRRAHLIPRRPKAFTRSRSVSTTSVSSSETRIPPSLAFNGAAGDENFGPLDRHMQQLIRKDELEELASSEARPMSSDRDLWGSKHVPIPLMREGPMQARHRDTVSQAKERLSLNIPQLGHRRARSADGRVGSDAAAVMLSTDEEAHSDEPNSPNDAGILTSIAMDLSSPVKDRPSPVQRKSKLRRLPFIRSHSKEHNKIGASDFAESQPGLSQENGRPPFVARHRTTESIGGASLQRNDSNTTHNTIDTSSREPNSTIEKLFKGGRISDMVRSETSRYRSRGQAGPHLTTSTSYSSDADGTDRLQTARDVGEVADDDSDASLHNSDDHGKVKQRYYLPNLPSFKSPSTRNKSAAESPMYVDDSDPIGRQQRAQKDTKQWLTRFGQLAPLKVNLQDDNRSNPELVSSGQPYDPRRKGYGFPRNATSTNPRNSVVSFTTPGALGYGDGRATSLNQPGGKSEGQRHWSISDQAQPQRDSRITAKDVARVRALLLSSGIKARALQEQADAPRTTPLAYLEEVATFVGKDLGSPTRRQEHMTAARMLSSDIDSTTSSLQQALDEFSHATVQSLASRLDALQRKAGDQLTKLVNETSDDADAFTVELTTKQPQDVKRIDDAIDDLLRRRRRRFRLLRRTGFKVLEWFVLGLMWWIWFFVVVFKCSKRVVLAFLQAVKWLVTF